MKLKKPVGKTKTKNRFGVFQQSVARRIRGAGEIDPAIFYRRLVKIGRKIFEGKKLRFHFSLIIVSSALFIGSWQPNTLAQTSRETDKPKISVLKIHDRVEIKTTESLQVPVGHFRVSRGFSWFHAGDDLAADTGEPVRPFMAGRVVSVEKSSWGYGSSVIIQHDGTYATRYAHLSRIFVQTGESVSKETIVGEVGSTGFSTGPHLHFEVLENGKTIDPRQFLAY